MTVDNKTGESSPLTRASKGLKIATMDGTTEVALLPVDCNHCKRLLGRDVWVFATKVCPRSVCKGCKEICRQIHARSSAGVPASAAEIRSIRRDSHEEQLNQESEERIDDAAPNDIPADVPTLASSLGEQLLPGAGVSTDEDKLDNTQVSTQPSGLSRLGVTPQAAQPCPEIEESRADQVVDSTNYHDKHHPGTSESTTEKGASITMPEADDSMLSEFRLTLKNHNPMVLPFLNPTATDYQQDIQHSPNLETAETPPLVVG
jgi:hypothetical protein